MEVRQAKTQDLDTLTQLALQLWPGHREEELRCELAEIMLRKDAAFFLAAAEDIPVGFAQCQLRQDYVEGTDSSPVGYLEGIYVTEAFRGRGIAGKLLAACESWAKSKGCLEFASDCELENVQSLNFHLKLGFREANRIICFTKRL